MDLLCRDNYHYSRTVATLFTHCSSTVHALKNIKNGSHGTIYTFKNYFAIVFSVFNFNKNKLYPNGPLVPKSNLVHKRHLSFHLFSSSLLSPLSLLRPFSFPSLVFSFLFFEFYHCNYTDICILSTNHTTRPHYVIKHKHTRIDIQILKPKTSQNPKLPNIHIDSYAYTNKNTILDPF